MIFIEIFSNRFNCLWTNFQWNLLKFWNRRCVVHQRDYSRTWNQPKRKNLSVKWKILKSDNFFLVSSSRFGSRAHVDWAWTDLCLGTGEGTAAYCTWDKETWIEGFEPGIYQGYAFLLVSCWKVYRYMEWEKRGKPAGTSPEEDCWGPFVLARAAAS